MRKFSLSFNAPIVASTSNVPFIDGLAKYRDENTGLVPPEIVAAAHTYNVSHGVHTPYFGDPGQPGREYSKFAKLENEVLGR